jgi:hypothetical protein
MEVQKSNERITQGQEKIIQYIEDLKRNKHFLALITRLKKSHFSTQEEDPVYDEFINEFIKNSKETEHLINLYRKKIMGKSQKIYLFLAEEYGLSMELINDLIFRVFRREDDFSLSKWNDMCCVNDNYDNLLRYVPHQRPIPIEMDTERKTHIISYPVSIDIHRFATKRDVLDYIEKRWDLIESYLFNYTEKKVRVRKRKMDKQIVDFIWKNRKEKANKILELINEKFPENKLFLGYEDILKIISIEKSRRTKKIILGF